MLPSCRLTLCLLTWSLPSPADSQSTDSPILDLQDVIGIEIHRSSVGERALGGGQKSGLVIDEDRGPEFGIVQTVDPEAVRYRFVQIPTARNTWAGAMTVVPKGIKSPPGAFILDEECALLRFPGNRPDDVSVDDFEGPVYARMPLSSHLIGMGLAVALPNPKTITDDDGSRTPDSWIALIRHFGKRAGIDPDSLFLVATRAYAELAMTLAARMDFAGVVIEAPGEMMFAEDADGRTQGPAGSRKGAFRKSDAARPVQTVDGGDGTAETESRGDAWGESYFQSESHMVRYVEHARSIQAPVLVILAKGAPGYDLTRKTLLASFSAVDADISVALLEGSARSLPSPDAREPSRGASRYEKGPFEQWINRMEGFLITHARTKPHPLALRDATLPSPHLIRSATFDEMKGIDPRDDFPDEAEVP